MRDLAKRFANSSVTALAIVAPISLTSLPAAAAPLPGEGSTAAQMHRQAIQPVENVYWRHHYGYGGWWPGAFAGATLGFLGAALAAPAYYCNPYYNCGPYGGYYGGYYAYYHPYGYYGYSGYYGYPHRYWRHHYYYYR